MKAASAFGAMVGLVTVYLLTDIHPHMHEASEELGAGETFYTLALESAPVLLLAFLAAGLMHAFFNAGQAGWLSGGAAFSRASKGMLFGLPLPICSCGVLPLYQTLIRGGVSATAALAFLVATPELGIDAFLLSLTLLGEELAIARLVAAAIVALVVALVLGRFFEVQRPADIETVEVRTEPLSTRLVEGLRYGLGDLVDHTLPWVVVGLGVAALMEPLMSASWLSSLPWGVDVLLLTLVGLPGYVCASGATPMVAVLLHKGLSPGAAIAFLLTGPATNLTTFGVLASMHSKRRALAFGAMMALLSIAVGLVVNLVATDGWAVPPLHDMAEHAHQPLNIACFWILVALMGRALLRCGVRGLLSQVLDAIHVHDEAPADGA